MSNAIILGGGEFGSRFIAFVATAYLAVVLGPERFGILGYAFAVITYVSVFLDAGFVDVGTRDIAKQPGHAITLASSLTLVRLVVAIICFIILAIISLHLASNTDNAYALIITGLMLFAAALDTSWVFKGLEQGLPVSISLIIRRLMFAVLVIVFVSQPEDMLVAPLLQFTGELLGVLWLAKRLFTSGFASINLALAWRTYRSCASLIAAKLLRTSIISLDVILIGLLITDRAVGLYSAPYRFCFFLMAIAAALQIAYLPHIGNSEPGLERQAAVRRHLEITAALGIPLAAGGIYVAAPLIQLLFGTEYIEGTRAFQLLLCSLGILFLFAPLHNFLLAQDRLRWELWGIGIAAMLNLVLNLFWIPLYGIVGAALATLIAEAVILIWAGIAVWPAMGMTLLSPLAPPCAGTGVMIATLLALSGQSESLLFSVSVGVTIYIATLIVLRRIPEDVTSTLRRLIQRCGQAGAH